MNRKSKNKMHLAMTFALLFGICMCVLLVINDTTMRYDAENYWNLGIECGWDVRNLTSGFRGWLLPYFFSMCYKFGRLCDKEYLGYWLFASITFAGTFTIVFNRIAKILGFKVLSPLSYWGGGVCGIIFFVFFRGLFIYTLSDFYALSISLIDVVLLSDILNDGRKLRVKAIEAYFLGLGLYGAYNIRTIYLFLLIACVLVLIMWQLLEKKWRQLVVTLISCFLGILSCSIPQIISNHRLSGIYSWKVPTQGLMLKQLYWGILWERYATYCGDPSVYSSVRMEFADHIGQCMVDSAQISEFTSYGQFIKVILSHPLDFLGVYIRHFLNMLYPIYPNTYIFDITHDKTLFLLLFYTLLFLAVSTFVHNFELKSCKWVWLCLILLPCLCILPGAVEIRFFIALHFLIYMYAVLGVKEFFERFRKSKGRYIATYLIGFGLYIAYAGAMLGTTMHGTATIH